MEADGKRTIDRDALFCSGAEDYRIPPEPDENQKVVLRFRTRRDNAEQVYYIADGCEHAMEKEAGQGLFDFYRYEICLGGSRVLYHFKVVSGQDVCFYNRLGVAEEADCRFDFVITPGFKTPDWAKGAVMYQIFVDRFYNGDPDNDVTDGEYVYIGQPVRRVEHWEEIPSAMDVARFYGGDLSGVWEKLDYLQDLGVQVIYFNPLFVSPSNHKYDCQDYEHIDPHFGSIVRDTVTEGVGEAADNRDAVRYIVRTAGKENLDASDELFADFVSEAHRRGMRVILDGVFNHCGSFNKWLDGEEIYAREGGYEPGAFLSADSPYRSFFHFYDERREAWPRNKSYDGWWGHDTLPKLNYEESEKLVGYILNVARRWLKPPFNADGWRLDVAADLGHTAEYNHEFWRRFRRAVKEVNPDALILAEHYGDPSSWLEGDQWDSVMNYDAFMEPVTWFLTGMEKHSDAKDPGAKGDGRRFFDAMAYHMSRMQSGSILTAMNELSNHDHSRFLTRTNEQVGRIGTAGAQAAGEGVRMCVLREAVMIQMTWPGAPTIYYGDEAGLCGWTDPDSRRTYPWGREDLELIEFHRYMIRIHKTLPVLRRGSVKELLAGKDVIAFGRMLGGYHAVTVINNGAAERELEIPVWQLGVTDDMVLGRLMLTWENGYNVGAMAYPVAGGSLRVVMPPFSGALFASRADEFFPVVASVAGEGNDR